MPDISWGQRDKRGEWQPEEPPVPSVLFQWPFKPIEVFKYFFAPVGFLWPFFSIYALIAVVAWAYFTPALERTTTFQFGWIAEIYLRNVVLLTIVAGGFHLRLYTTRGQGKKFKFSDKWLAAGNKKFLFNNQTYDNVFWSLTSGCLIWTGYEAVTLWAYANEIIPYVDWQTHPVYFVLMMIAVVFLRSFHFYWVHRWSHWKPLFKISHYLHHKNINIGPWSGLSMHPIEHLLYFSGVFFHWIIPSHPIHAIFHLMHAGITPAEGHTGFAKLVTKGEQGIKSNHYFHYLHHKYFTVNFGVEAVPLDKWFGSFHDGTPEAGAVLQKSRVK
jgi:sterol desaturase/sphingolipid hydroxylase (fatty acid hydroxylase superfamily)